MDQSFYQTLLVHCRLQARTREGRTLLHSDLERGELDEEYRSAIRSALSEPLNEPRSICPLLRIALKALESDSERMIAAPIN